MIREDVLDYVAQGRLASRDLRRAMALAGALPDAAAWRSFTEVAIAAVWRLGTTAQTSRKTSCACVTACATGPSNSGPTRTSSRKGRAFGLSGRATANTAYAKTAKRSSST